MKAYSLDLRERVAAAVDGKQGSQRAIARRFGVSLSFVVRLLQHRRETGGLEPTVHHAHRPYALDAQARLKLRELVRKHPDATLEQYVEMGGFDCDPSTIWRTLRRMGLTRKKKTRRASERDRPDVRAKRTRFRGEARMMDAKRLYFLDETSLTTTMTTAYGWAPRGERVVESVPTSWTATTLISAIGLDGVAASMALPGALDERAFATFIEDVLAPALPDGAIVLADNLSAHNSATARAALRKAGAVLLNLPPYSSDYNPIEEMWSKLKQRIRRAKARTIAQLYDAMAEALQSITPKDIEGWFRHSGLYAVG